METYNLILRDKKGDTIGGEVVRGHPEIGRKINLQSGASKELHGQYRIFDIEDVVAPNCDGDLESITYAYAKKIELQGGK